MRPARYYGIALTTWLVLGGLGAIVAGLLLPGDSTPSRLVMATVVLVAGLVSDRLARAVTAGEEGRSKR